MTLFPVGSVPRTGTAEPCKHQRDAPVPERCLRSWLNPASFLRGHGCKHGHECQGGEKGRIRGPAKPLGAGLCPGPLAWLPGSWGVQVSCSVAVQRQKRPTEALGRAHAARLHAGPGGPLALCSGVKNGRGRGHRSLASALIKHISAAVGTEPVPYSVHRAGVMRGLALASQNMPSLF